MEAARAAGLEPMNAVSGRTDVLVCADPESQSGKARKARALGTLTGAVRETPDWWGPDPALEDLFYGATGGKPKRVCCASFS